MNSLGQPNENEVALSLIEHYCDICKASVCAGCPVFEFRGTPNAAYKSVQLDCKPEKYIYCECPSCHATGLPEIFICRR
jgi:hypothetical protein